MQKLISPGLLSVGLLFSLSSNASADAGLQLCNESASSDIFVAMAFEADIGTKINETREVERSADPQHPLCILVTIKKSSAFDLLLTAVAANGSNYLYVWPYASAQSRQIDKTPFVACYDKSALPEQLRSARMRSDAGKPAHKCPTEKVMVLFWKVPFMAGDSISVNFKDSSQ